MMPTMRWTAAYAAVIFVGGCVGPFNKDDFMAFEPAPDQIAEIESVRLEEESLTKPVTIEEAVEDDAVQKLADVAQAPDSITLSLEEVRAASLTGNLDLQVELVSPSIAEATVDEEEAKFEWAFTSAVSRSRIDSPTPTPLIEGSRTTINSFDMGVRVPLRTGGTANVRLPFNDTETNNPQAFLDPSYNADLSFSISQPLFRGAGNRVNTHSIRVAKYQHQIAGARTKLETMRVLAAADRAYWNLYAAQRELEVRQVQYERAMGQLESAHRKVDAGTVAAIEIIRAETGVAQRLEAIIIADTTVRRRERDLKRIMQRDELPMHSPTAIVLGTEPSPLGLELDPDALADFAVANRMEMLELEIQLAIDASTVDFQRNARMPLITLDYRYNINGLGRNYDRAFGQIPDHTFEDWSVGVAAEIPLGNEAATARLHRAILQRMQRLATKEQRREVIRQEVFNSVDQLQQNWQRILAARQEAISAGRTYEAEQRQFREGARTSTDVLDAAANLADAQSREIRALTDYQIAQVDIAFATGTLLGYERVRWEAVDVEEIK